MSVPGGWGDENAAPYTPRSPARSSMYSPMGRGFNVNEQETTLDKSLSGYVPLHWAAQKGLGEMLQLLVRYGASATIKDKHGNIPRALAEKKGHKEIVTQLEEAEKAQAKAARSKS